MANDTYPIRVFKMVEVTGENPDITKDGFVLVFNSKEGPTHPVFAGKFARPDFVTHIVEGSAAVYNLAKVIKST